MTTTRSLHAPRRARRHALTAALALAATLALTSCTLITTIAEAGNGGGNAVSDPTDSPAGLYDADLDAALQPYYEQRLDWSTCEGDFECATASAPMNWDDPSAGDIELAMLRVPATGTPRGSLFINPGGPGASGINLATYASYIFGPTVLRNYDIVGWDPRGVGASSAVDCLDDADMDAYLYPTPTADTPQPGEPGYEELAIEQAAAFGAACLDKTGPLLEFVDTQSTIRDLDLLRATVGDAQLSYFGFSYGTEIGAQYINRFPERVGRMVLDGATDPSLSTFEVILGQQVGFARTTEAYLDDCKTASGCPFSGSTDDSIAQIRAMMDEADAVLPRNVDGRVLTSSVISTAINSAMYAAYMWSDLTDAFSSYEASGSPRGFFALADRYNDRNANGTYSGNLMEAFTAINCLDSPAETDPQVIADFNAEYAELNPFAEPSESALGDITCQQWPFQARVTPQPVSGAGAAPVLVIGTTGDPATPYEWAQSLSEQLESAVLVTWEGDEHTAYGGKSTCIDRIVDDYLVDGTVPSTPPSCR